MTARSFSAPVSGVNCAKHRHLICGACDGFKCEECLAADDGCLVAAQPVAAA